MGPLILMNVVHAETAIVDGLAKNKDALLVVQKTSNAALLSPSLHGGLIQALTKLSQPFGDQPDSHGHASKTMKTLGTDVVDRAAGCSTTGGADRDARRSILRLLTVQRAERYGGLVDAVVRMLRSDTAPYGVSR